MSDEFTTEDFKDTDSVQQRPLEEGEQGIVIAFAKEKTIVRYFKNMTVQDAFNQCAGEPSNEKGQRILLDNQISTLDSIIPTATTMIIFVGTWVLGNKKKVILY